MKQITEEEWFSNWCPYQNYLIENSREGLEELKEIVLLNDLGVSINKSLINSMKGIKVILKVPVLFEVEGVIEDAYINEKNKPVLILGSPLNTGEYEIEIIDADLLNPKWGYRGKKEKLFPALEGYMYVRYEGTDQKNDYFCFSVLEKRLYWELNEIISKNIKNQIKKESDNRIVLKDFSLT